MTSNNRGPYSAAVINENGEKIIISPNRVTYFDIYLSMSDLFSFIVSNTDKHEFISIWKWINFSTGVMNHADCVIKRDVYPQKMHTCSKNIRGISVFVLKNIRGISGKKIMGDIAWIFALLKDKMLNPVFIIISVISRRPVKLSIISISSFLD